MSIMKIRGRRNQKGFTLVELMVVLVIIAILVAIAIPIYNKTQDNAQTQACRANLRTISGAIAQYQAENAGTLPPNLDALVTGGYLKAVPKCPKEDPPGTKKDYEYTPDQTNGTYTLTCPNRHSL